MFGEFHNLNDFKRSYPGNHRELVELIGFYSAGPIVDINNVCFLITLAFLFPANSIEDLKTRLKILLPEGSTITDVISDEDVMNLHTLLNDYNPFQNNWSCFRNEIFLTVARKFDKAVLSRIERKGTEISGIFPSAANLPQMKAVGIKDHPNFLLEEASDFLKCDIVLCDVVEKSIHKFPDKMLSGHPMLILCVGCDKALSVQNFYTTGIRKDVGKDLQEKAAKKILSQVGISPEAIRCVTSLSPEENNITLKLLKENMVSAVSLLFQQPVVLFEITTACYDVSSTTCDDQGKSALCYALEKGNKHLVLQFLQTFFYLSELSEITLPDTPPKSEEEICLEHLEEITSILRQQKSIFEAASASDPVIFLEQLLQINSFYKAMAGALLKINAPVRLSVAGSSIVPDINKQRDRMKVILSTYENYFKYPGSSCSENDTSQVSLFRNLTPELQKYEMYYNTVDLATSALFFDNLFSLKRGLHFEDNICGKTESAFFHLVFTNHFLESKENTYFERCLEESARSKFAIDKSCYSYIICLERLKCLKTLQAFKEALTPVAEDAENIQIEETECAQRSYPEPLESLPEIRDVIIFRTVFYYLTVISELRDELLANKSIIDEKAILAVERALQVVGENLNERFTDGVSLGKSLLISTLPMNVRKMLRSIRDNLSHIDRKTAEGRLRIESRKEIFEKIVDELENIRIRFIPSFVLLELTEYGYMYEKWLTHFEEIQSELSSSNDSHHPKPEQSISELSKNVEEKINSLKNAKNIIQEKSGTFQQYYIIHLKNHFDYVNHYLSTNEPESDNKILFHLKCSAVLLNSFLKYCPEQFSKSKKAIRNFVNEIETAITGIYSKSKICSCDNENGTNLTIEWERVKTKIKNIITECQSTCKAAKSLTISKPHELSKSVKQSYEPLPQTPQSTKKRRCYAHQEPETDFCTFQSNDIIDYPYIKELANSLESFYPITTEQQQFILEKVPKSFKDKSEAKISLEETFQSIIDGKRNLTEDVKCDIEANIDKLVQEQSKRRDVLKKELTDESHIKTNLDDVRSRRDNYGELSVIFDKNKLIDCGVAERYCSSFGFKGKPKELLKKCIKGKKFTNAKDALLKFLRDKIIILENLLVPSDSKVQRIWTKPRNLIQMHKVFFLIKEQYKGDRILQSAVEMLLFDCMNILKDRTDLKSLWTKAKDLFSGIDFRNMLSHNDPLFKQTGCMVRPDDFPSEIIRKCLELVDDRRAIQAMCKLLEGTNGTRDTLFDKVRKRQHGSEVLCDAVDANEKWKDYAQLLPGKSATKKNSRTKKKSKAKTKSSTKKKTRTKKKSSTKKKS